MAVLEGKAYWASVTTPNTTFEPVYTVDLVVEDDVANEFQARGFKVKDLSVKDESGGATPIGRALTIKQMPQNFSTKIKNHWMRLLVMARLLKYSITSGKPIINMVALKAWIFKLCRYLI